MLWVAAGGAAGALARGRLAESFPTAPGVFPWTTFAENAVGAFLLALVLTWLVEQTSARPQVRLAVCTGASGAFTTYSTLATEATTRLAGGHALLARYSMHPGPYVVTVQQHGLERVWP